jgi:transposase
LEALARTYAERNSYRSTGRIFGISHVSVGNYLKKKPGPSRRSKPVLRPFNRPGRWWKWTRYFRMCC